MAHFRSRISSQKIMLKIPHPPPPQHVQKHRPHRRFRHFECRMCRKNQYKRHVGLFVKGPGCAVKTIQTACRPSHVHRQTSWMCCKSQYKRHVAQSPSRPRGNRGCVVALEERERHGERGKEREGERESEVFCNCASAFVRPAGRGQQH